MGHVDPAHQAALAALQSDWDGYGAAPLTYEAKKVIEGMSVVPTNSGGVQFEWHTEGWDVEVEFDPDGSVGSFTVEKARQVDRE